MFDFVTCGLNRWVSCPGRWDAQVAVEARLRFEGPSRSQRSFPRVSQLNVRSTHIYRIEVANFCLKLKSVLGFDVGGCEGPAFRHFHG